VDFDEGQLMLASLIRRVKNFASDPKVLIISIVYVITEFFPASLIFMFLNYKHLFSEYLIRKLPISNCDEI